MVVELARVLSHVVAHALEEDPAQEDGGLLRLEVRDEDLGRGEGGMRSPVCWRGDGKQASPLREGREELERFRQGSGSIPREQLADSAEQVRPQTIRLQENGKTHLV